MTNNQSTGYVATNTGSIELPKGGGAIRGISEKFSANPVTGTASLSIPLPISPARNFQPELALSYDSGSGNSAFGIGWNAGVASIGRKTDKGLPQYQDHQDSDTYTLGGAEDLVPFLHNTDQNWSEKINTIVLAGQTWEVKLYRPRIESAYSKIERWRDKNTNTIWWRTVSTNNVTTVFGFHDSACVFEPGNRAKTFRWMIDFSYDDKGHFTQYEYKRENLEGVRFDQVNERHRRDKGCSQLYLKKVLYGIKQSRLKSNLSDEDLFTHTFAESDFHFQTVFDYGDHSDLTDGSVLSQPDIGNWPARIDAFSNYRAGFEIRTYRRCQRIMLFHDFPELDNQPELISSVNLSYDDLTEGFSFLTAIQSFSYKRGANGNLESASMPKIEYAYKPHIWSEQLNTIDIKSLESIPAGVDGHQYQWVDLYGEGLNGILTEQMGALHYKQNVGGAAFAKTQIISPSPSLKGFGNGWNFQDLESNGIKSLVSTNGVVKGYYQFDDQNLDGNNEWQQFMPFEQMPNIRFDDPNLRVIDLNGDGKADLLISEEQVMRWYPSLGKQGYDAAQFALKQSDGEGPEIIFSNEAESIFTADMTGDGLSDIVRIRNGCVVYWPNLGYGNFGNKVTMEHAPTFNHPDLFTANHIRLADLDGSGTTDIIYLGRNAFQYWLNNSGNGWSEAYQTLNPFPDIDNLSTVSVVDLLGTGTACVVWSSSAPNSTNASLRYIDLMASQKPHLMKSYKNGFGKTVNFEYTPSTQFYLEDKTKGEPWVTKLHFPVHCLSKVESIDHITGARFASSYSYHHGYYDHAEREFRGFGRVDQIDAEEYEHFVKAGSSNVQERVLHQTPVLVKTWFHNGAYLDQTRILSQYQKEYCDYDNPEYAHLEKFKLSQPALPNDLSPAEWREALRACKGMALRTETYGLDSTDKQDKPFSIAYNTCQIKRIQPKLNNSHAVFQVHNSESISITLDRNIADPRISHQLLLETNVYGQPLLSATVSYGRNPQAQPSNLPSEVLEAQRRAHCAIAEVEYTTDEYGLLGQHQLNTVSHPLRAPAQWKSNNYQYGIDNNQWTDGACKLAKLLSDFKAVPSANYVNYLREVSDEDFAEVSLGEVRLLSSSQSYFANANLNGSLPAGTQSPTGIGWNSYQMAFTPALIELIYGNKVDASSLEGAYVDLNQDGNWWVGSGYAIYHHPNETALAQDRFYIPFGARDLFGAANWIKLDAYLMLPESSSVSRIGYDNPTSDALYLELNESIAINDYRTLGPKYTRDANDNWSGVEIDALGLVVKSAIMGKVTGANRNNPPADNAVTEGDNLQNPSAEMQYGFYDEMTNQPAWVKSKTYTQHYSQQQIPRGNITSRLDLIEQYEYSDGSGNVVMVKAQTTPGLAKQLQANGSVIEVDTRTLTLPDRWIGNGRTIINNKGNPVKQYEPYFSVTHEYESAAALVETGITPILFYDAAGRNVCKLNPNKTYEKVVFDAWSQQSWDANDTLFLPQQDGTKLTDITADPDVGHFFAALENTEISPSWYASRINGSDLQQKHAAEKTELHVATPSTVYTDALGRTIYGLAHNRYPDKNGNIVDEQYATKTQLDIEGNMLSVTDARGNVVMRYRYNLLPPPDKENPKPALYQNSMDGGEKWSLFDSQGKALKAWDSRDHVFESFYDAMHRPSHTILTENAVRKKISLSEYVDSDHADATVLKQNNLVGSAIANYDQAGRSQIVRADFKGNPLTATRTLVNNYKTTIDWDAGLESQLEDDVFVSESQYDALNRIVSATSPHHAGIEASMTRPTYNEAGALNTMLASIRSHREEDLNTYVEKIEHDAKGQRQFIEYGNGVVTTYEYESDTYRLKRLLTKKSNGTKLQDLSYSFDPVGNISEIRDAAQNTVFFNNDMVEPHREYTYDALYRLISATGREHATQANMPSSTNGWETLRASDDLALQKYIQTYAYDGVGNIMKMAHRRPNDNNTGWTRHYQYAEQNNRLLATTLGNPDLPFSEPYSYNVHGSMTSMLHLQTMDWDFVEQLRHVDLGGGGHGYYVYGADGQRTRKVIETGSLIKDRIYLGGWEIYRERNANAASLQRESLHVMDDQQRIALIETKTLGENDAEGLRPIARYQLGNHLGSVNLELDDVGEIVSYEEFHPYGTSAYHAGTGLVTGSKKRYRYTGKERDEETGFSYHGARYLSFWLGRWCSTDPIGIGDSMNLYFYVHGNPILSTDLSGTCTMTPAQYAAAQAALERKLATDTAAAIAQRTALKAGATILEAEAAAAAELAAAELAAAELTVAMEATVAAEAGLTLTGVGLAGGVGVVGGFAGYGGLVVADDNYELPIMDGVFSDSAGGWQMLNSYREEHGWTEAGRVLAGVAGEIIGLNSTPELLPMLDIKTRDGKILLPSKEGTGPLRWHNIQQSSRTKSSREELGYINFKIDSPKGRELIQYWLDTKQAKVVHERVSKNRVLTSLWYKDFHTKEWFEMDSNMNMGHIVSAVEHYQTIKHLPEDQQKQLIEEFMGNVKNYRPERMEFNASDGARLGQQFNY